MTPIDASNQPEYVIYYAKYTKATSNLEVSDYVRIANKSNIFF